LYVSVRSVAELISFGKRVEMAVEIRPAGLQDVAALVALMQAFYAEANFTLSAAPALAAFEALLSEPRLGAGWLAMDGIEAVGHVVLTTCFVMEYGGLRGVIDDPYVRPAARGRGAGAGVLAAARTGAAARDVRALYVQVGLENVVARRVYGRAGYTDRAHLLLSLPLAAPVHAV
jgi:GNAT superfamily N-acetyltransferase